jgi:hypothetical protein
MNTRFDSSFILLPSSFRHNFLPSSRRSVQLLVHQHRFVDLASWKISFASPSSCGYPFASSQ